MTARSLLGLGTVALTAFSLSTAAFAEGKTDQARKAIAAAQAKIDASNIVGASGDAPRLHSQAVAMLHHAQDELGQHAKDDAIRDATRASELADMALAASQHERNGAQQATTAEAQRQASDAQREAAEANARAAAAQADAAAARSAPPVVIQTPAPASAPAPTSTTVTTQTDQEATAATRNPSARSVVRKRVVHRHAVSRRTRTTTTVTTHNR